MGTIGFLIPKNIGIDTKIVTISSGIQVMAQYVISHISMAATFKMTTNRQSIPTFFIAFNFDGGGSKESKLLGGGCTVTLSGLSWTKRFGALTERGDDALL